MKLKILMIFVVIAVISVFSVFYVKNYLFYSRPTEKISTEEISIQKSFKLIGRNMAQFKNYSGEDLTSKSMELKTGQSIFELAPEEITYDSVIVHFWASWCDPCINEIPELLEYLKRHEQAIKDKKLGIVLVSVDYEVEAISKFLKSFPDLNAGAYVQIWDKEAILQKSFNIDRLPSTYILHKNKPLEKYLTVVDWKRM